MERLQLSSEFRIIVKTNRPKTKIIEFSKEKNAYLMDVKAIPEKGKANLEIMKFFKKEYKKDVTIIGKTSKLKLIRVKS